MSRPAQTLPVGNDNTQHLSLGVIALCFPAAAVQRAIDACGKSSAARAGSARCGGRLLCHRASVSFRPPGMRACCAPLLCGLQWLDSGKFRVSSKAALSKARQRLGEAPLRFAL